LLAATTPAAGLVAQTIALPPVPYDPTAPVAAGRWITFTSSSTDDVYDTQTGQIASHDTSPINGDGRAVAAVGDKIIFAGGGIVQPFALSGADGVNIYDTSTGSWSSTTLVSGRFDAAAAVLGGKVIFAGGYFYQSEGGQSLSKDVDIYDADTGQWSSGTMPLESGADELAVVGDKAIFSTETGFRRAVDQPLQIYDASTGQWSTSPINQPPLGSGGISAVAVGHYALFAGGATADARRVRRDNLVDVYDDSTGQWSTARLSQSTRAATSLAVGDVALFAAYESPIVDLFNARSGTWSRTVAPEEISYGYASALGQKAIFAGRDRLHDQYNTLVYDVPSGQWSILQSEYASRLNAAVTAGDAAYLFGSDDASRAIADVLTVTHLDAPGDPLPADGAGLNAAAAVLRWSATPGATAYDVYLDNLPAVRNVQQTRYLLNDVDTGDHTWQVVAHLADGSTLSGPALRLHVRGPRVRVRLLAAGLLKQVTPETTSQATVTLRNSGDGALRAPFAVTIYTGFSRDFRRNLGPPAVGSLLIDQPLDAGQKITVLVPISFASFAGATTPSNQLLFAAVETRHLFGYASAFYGIGPRVVQIVPAPAPSPAPTHRRGAATAGGKLSGA
jgi:hypothetical protein